MAGAGHSNLCGPGNADRLGAAWFCARQLRRCLTTLGKAELIETGLAGRLAEAARQRNLLVHLYLDIDDRMVFEFLSHLDDLRQFATFVGGQLD